MGATVLTDYSTRGDKVLAKREESIYALRYEAHQSRPMRFLRQRILRGLGALRRTILDY